MSDTPPPLAEHTINEQAKEFLYSVGEAITEWATIDEQLFLIFTDVLRTDQHLSAIIYYRTNTLGARLSLVDELVRAVCPKPARKSGGHVSKVEEHWTARKTEMDDLLATRNHLAHSPASPHATFDPNSDSRNVTITDVWWASYVSRTEKMRGRPPKKDLKINDVKAHLGKVHQLWMKLRDFRDELSKLPR